MEGMAALTAENRNARENARSRTNGQFGKQDNSEPEVSLAPAARPVRPSWADPYRVGSRHGQNDLYIDLHELSERAINGELPAEQRAIAISNQAYTLLDYSQLEERCERSIQTLGDQRGWDEEEREEARGAWFSGYAHPEYGPLAYSGFPGDLAKRPVAPTKKKRR
ncbi:hypothetical protein SAMN04488590_3207 [Microbacterium sp. 77mftsu3.1]|nr:hypothetical protein SAMN04488590_3207 [Microbacterium sp. 77mftsu3.1]